MPEFKRHPIWNWHWTIAMVDRVKVMARRGAPAREIAGAMNCTPDEVRAMAKRNGIAITGAGSGA